MADDWLPPLISFSAHGGNWNDYLAILYEAFSRDFIHSKPAYAKTFQLKSHPIRDGKEATFWHLISSGKIEEERLPEIERCECINWPRAIIERINTDQVRCWRQENRGKNRIAITLIDFSYLVVLEDRPRYVLLWTAYPVKYNHQREKLRREFERFQGQNPGAGPVP